MRIKELIQEYNEIFYHQPWYGESVMNTLKSLTSKEVNYKINAISNSIAEIVDHIMKWKAYTIEKLLNNEAFDIEDNTSSDWNHTLIIKTEQDWKDLLEALTSSHEKLIQLLGTKDDAWLSEKTSGKNYLNDYLVRGIVYHDVYHLGQIRLIKAIVANLH